MASQGSAPGPGRGAFIKGAAVTIRRRDGATQRGLVAAAAARRSYIPVAVAGTDPYVRWVPANEVTERTADAGDKALRTFVRSDACQRALAKRGGPAPARGKPAPTKPAGSRPTGSKPAGSKPAGSKPAPSRPARSQPAAPPARRAKSERRPKGQR